MMSELEKEVDRGKRGRRWFLVATSLAAISVIPLAIWLAVLTVDEQKQGQKLRGVDVAGPCRAYGIQNNECQKQARRIFAACYVQQEECWDKYGLPRRRIPDRGRGIMQAHNSDGARGDALQTESNPGNQQPGPRDDGGDQGVGEHGDRGGRGDGASGDTGADQSPLAPIPAPLDPDLDTGGDPGEAAADPGLIESVTGAAGAVDEAGKGVEGTVDKATCNPVVSLCPIK